MTTDLTIINNYTEFDQNEMDHHFVDEDDVEQIICEAVFAGLQKYNGCNTLNQVMRKVMSNIILARDGNIIKRILLNDGRFQLYTPEYRQPGWIRGHMYGEKTYITLIGEESPYVREAKERLSTEELNVVRYDKLRNDKLSLVEQIKAEEKYQYWINRMKETKQFIEGWGRI